METTIDSFKGFEFCKTENRFINVYIIYAPAGGNNFSVLCETPKKVKAKKLWNLLKDINK